MFLLTGIFILIMFVIVVEAITELLSKSEIFKPFREFFFNRRECKLLGFIHNLLDCGYCTSVWVSFFVVTVFISFSNTYLDIFLMSIVIHRLSNIFHFVIDRINKDR
jgi:hypothetical protein